MTEPKDPEPGLEEEVKVTVVTPEGLGLSHLSLAVRVTVIEEPEFTEAALETML